MKQNPLNMMPNNDSVIVSSGFLVGQKIGIAIGTLLNFQVPVVGYLIGSLIGTAFSVVYQIGKKKLISFCVDSSGIGLCIFFQAQIYIKSHSTV